LFLNGRPAAPAPNSSRCSVNIEDGLGAEKEGGPLPPPGRNAGRSPTRRGRSSAALTFNRRPPTSRLWKRVIASAASLGCANSTNAKPRGRPVSRSVGRCTLTTRPASASSAVNSSFVVLKFKLPTKTFVEMAAPSGPTMRRLNGRGHSPPIGNVQEGVAVNGHPRRPKRRGGGET